MIEDGQTDPITFAPEKTRGSDELKIFMTGCGMLIIWIALSALLWYLKNEMYSSILTLGFAQCIMGRGVSIARATEIGMHPALIIAFVVFIDIMLVFIVYPALVFSYRNLFEKRFFKHHIRPVFDSARKRIGKLGRFKFVGVFAFVCFPFWSTGVIMGSVLGFLMGLRPWSNMMTVIAATTAAVMCWVYAYDRLYKWAGGINESIPGIITILIVLTLLVSRVISGRKRAKLNSED